MAGLHIENDVLSAEEIVEITAHAAALAEQERLITQAHDPAVIKADRYKQFNGIPTVQIVRATIFAGSITDSLKEVRAELDLAQNIPTVQAITAEDGNNYLSIPDLQDFLHGDWQQHIFEYQEEAEEIDPAIRTLEENKHLVLDLKRLEDRRYSIAMNDILENPMTRLRLSGTLELADFPTIGSRLVYKKDPLTFIHPSVILQTPQILGQVVNIIKSTPPNISANYFGPESRSFRN